jgi:hypothetical protein
MQLTSIKQFDESAKGTNSFTLINPEPMRGDDASNRHASSSGRTRTRDISRGSSVTMTQMMLNGSYFRPVRAA